VKKFSFDFNNFIAGRFGSDFDIDLHRIILIY